MKIVTSEPVLECFVEARLIRIAADFRPMTLPVPRIPPCSNHWELSDQPLYNATFLFSYFLIRFADFLRTSSLMVQFFTSLQRLFVEIKASERISHLCKLFGSLICVLVSSSQWLCMRNPVDSHSTIMSLYNSLWWDHDYGHEQL